MITMLIIKTDLKATALLKLIYLEMFGHDMSWASFHVLEVMSSPKYIQKRVGYLGAVQSFRPDTEVLMLATNLLKKDISSALPPTISLPLVTLPHVITSSLALSLLSDLLPRLSHSKPAIRKKTVVALYRLALVYPDTLRPAWPKIKDLLMNEQEDSSVTAAVINVVCELGWRRPKDFLPLAPRLFDLLVDGGNNWMAIKIIKLFATLTPLEPRLIKKLLPPLTTLIRTTPAMSLLYECINGIIQGGILEGTEGVREGEEIASLCVGKLRGMIMVEDDPNLRYVALLTFKRIVTSHAHLVSNHQDAILSCIDDPDISIRLQALDLGASMVNSENLTAVVERLMRQLKNAPPSVDATENTRHNSEGVEPAADSDGEDPGETLKPIKGSLNDAPPLPAEYRISIMRRILDMCSRETYTNISDFEWYIDTLVQLVKLVPPTNQNSSNKGSSTSAEAEKDISSEIGLELQNVAVRVSTVREEAVSAAASLIAVDGSESTFQNLNAGGQGVLQSAIWIVGEYAHFVSDPSTTLSHAIHPKVRYLASPILSTYLQAIPKIMISITSHDHTPWTSERNSMTSLLLARITHFLEPLTTHPNLEVQERCVEFLELMRVAAQAVTNHDTTYSTQGPLLLTRAIPSLYTGDELKPVAPTAQEKVPLPDNLDLDIPINENLASILQRADLDDDLTDTESSEFDTFYNVRPSRKTAIAVAGPAIETLPSAEPEPLSYQQTEGTASLDPEALSRKRLERRIRNKDDPFYIPSEDNNNNVSGASTPFHDILRSTNGEDVDVDSIPIMNLDLGDQQQSPPETSDPEPRALALSKRKKAPKKHHVVALDENLDLDIPQLASTSRTASPAPPLRAAKATRRNPLQVDSSSLGAFSLNGEGDDGEPGRSDEAEDKEMAKALAEVERLRMEMQRASERVVVPEGTLVKKKKKRRKGRDVLGGDGAGNEEVELVAGGGQVEVGVRGGEAGEAEAEVEAVGVGEGAGGEFKKKKKKKKKREIVLETGEEIT